MFACLAENSCPFGDDPAFIMEKGGLQRLRLAPERFALKKSPSKSNACLLAKDALIIASTLQDT